DGGRRACPERVFAARGEVVYPFVLFAGPKVSEELEAVQPPAAVPGAPPGAVAAGIHLEKAAHHALGMLARPILWLLKFFHSFVHNWGLAIVLLTLFIR